MHRILTGALVASLLTTIAVVLSGGAAQAATSGARIVRWVDGDTVVTTRGTVRLIGIDTPERGSCGSTRATTHARKIAPIGSRIRLGNPASVVNRDRYGRILRYVETPAGQDLGLAQIKDGARARYDSTDGYQRHPRQADYHRADAQDPGYRCTVPAPAPAPAPAPIGWDCPLSAPIKGNADSMIYHMPGQQYYDRTNPEECFATEAAAQAAGYRRALI